MAELTPSADVPPLVPGYELLRCIGRGSYGEVWLARDGAGGFRAVKIVYRKTFEQDRPFERELSGIQKFEPISRSHPSQVNILQVGRNHEEGYFYYVMELADPVSSSEFRVSSSPTGRQLEPLNLEPETYVPRTLKSELTTRGRLSFQECLNISLALATALEHLHQHGLIHRDIKPSNVIFVQGVPKLADIGLVTDAGASVSFVGTEGFLPPEGPGTAQADLYSLGKVLYEISTGRDRMEFPELPTFVDEAAEKEHLLELNQIFLKACQNDVRRRYQSAREMSSDLALLHSGKSLRRARAVGQRLAQVKLFAGAAVFLVVVAALANYIIQQQRIRRVEAESAQRERDKRLAQTVAAGQTRRLADIYAASGRVLEADGDYPGALLLYSQSLSEGQGDPAHAAECRQRLASLWQRMPTLFTLLAHAGGVNSASFGGDGRRVVTAGDDRIAHVWDDATGGHVGQPLIHPDRVTLAELSADSERALTITADGTAQLWSQLSTMPVAAKLEHEGRFTLAGFSPNGRQFVAVTDGSEALLWETSSRRLRFTLKQRARIQCIAFSADGRSLATGSTDQSAQVWDTETAQPITPALAHESGVTHLAFSPDGRRLATANGSRARIWSARSGDPASFTLAHDAALTSITFSPDGKQLLTAGEDQVARVWDAISGQPIAPVLRHHGAVRQAIFSPDGRFIATACGTRAQVWNARTFELIPPFFIHNAAVLGVQFSPASHRLLTASADGTARLLAMDDDGSARGLPVPPEGGSDHWQAWAQLVSGRQISSNEQVTPIPAESLRKLSADLGKKSTHGPGAPELAAWHQQAAEACEKSGQWFAAGFHWDRALASQPGEGRFRAGRERAARELARSEVASTGSDELPRGIPARADDTRAELIDLSGHYNGTLSESWLPTTVASGQELSALPQGAQKFNGVEFEVRGVVQLSGGALENFGGKFPSRVSGIRVGQMCRKIHFLHGAAWPARAGTHIGSYVVHYAGGESREVKMVFGQNVREWLASSAPQLITGAAVAWEGSNPASRAMGLTVRLYQMTWLNPLPALEVQHIDFRTTMESSAPFLIAITAE